VTGLHGVLCQHLQRDGEPSQCAQSLQVLDILGGVVGEDMDVKIWRVVGEAEGQPHLQPLAKERDNSGLLLFLLVCPRQVSKSLEDTGPGLTENGQSLLEFQRKWFLAHLPTADIFRVVEDGKNCLIMTDETASLVSIKTDLFPFVAGRALLELESSGEIDPQMAHSMDCN